MIKQLVQNLVTNLEISNKNKVSFGWKKPLKHLVMLQPKNFGLVHLTRLELAHPKALPPQGSVYTNFTTGACNYIIVKY